VKTGSRQQATGSREFFLGPGVWSLLRLRWIMEANSLVYASGRIERVKPIAIETEGVEYFI